MPLAARSEAVGTALDERGTGARTMASAQDMELDRDLDAEHEELQATHEGLQKSMFDMKRRVAAQYKKRPPTWGSIELYKDKEEPKPTAAEEVGPPYSSAGDQMERCDVDGFEMVATTSRSATEQSE